MPVPCTPPTQANPQEGGGAQLARAVIRVSSGKKIPIQNVPYSSQEARLEAEVEIMVKDEIEIGLRAIQLHETLEAAVDQMLRLPDRG